jgi:hypothetical protein
MGQAVGHASHENLRQLREAWMAVEKRVEESNWAELRAKIGSGARLSLEELLEVIVGSVEESGVVLGGRGGSFKLD